MGSISETELVTHSGGCHCGRVRWRAKAPKSVVAWTCNCSICSKRGSATFSVPSERFELLSGKSNITTYTFGTHTAKHTFCNVCGITSFYSSRTNPKGFSVNLPCIDPGTVTQVEMRSFDGLNWEESYARLK